MIQSSFRAERASATDLPNEIVTQNAVRKSEQTQINNNSPIFIFGSPRSGTTFVRSILNAHPSVCCPRETAFYLLSKNIVNMNQSAVDFWDTYKLNRRFTYHNIEVSIIEGKMKNFEFTYKNLFSTIMSELAKKRE